MIKNIYEESLDGYCRKVLEATRDKELFVWGAGLRLYDFDKFTVGGLKIHGVVDSDENKIGNKVTILEKEYVIQNPKEVATKRKDVFFIILSQAYVEIENQLRDYGVEEEHFCNFIDFICAWNWAREKKVVIDEINISLGTICNLKCKGCIAKVDYIKKPVVRDVEEIKETFDNFFRHVDYVKRIIMAGGETFLFSTLPEILGHLYNNYNHKLGKVVLISNGMIMPKKEFLQAAQGKSIEVRISDYGELQKKETLQQIVQVLDKYGIENHVEKKFGIHTSDAFWFDLGNPYDKQNKSEIELKEHFAKCTNVSRIVGASRLFFCPTQQAVVENLDFFISEEDMVNLRKEEPDKEAFLVFYMGGMAKGYLDVCDCCNGFGRSANNKLIPVGQQ